MRRPDNLTAGNAHVDLRDARPDLQSLLLMIYWYLQLALPGCEVCITSLKRATGTHAPGPDGLCWSVDFDVKWEGTWLKDGHPEVKAALLKTKGLVELVYPYGVGGDGKGHHAFVWETPDGRHNDHVHLQVNPANTLP
jgi:hypothetical protein